MRFLSLRRRPLRAAPGPRCPALAVALLLGACFVADRAAALEVQGFTEPYRTIDVASPETGIVDKLHVEEGQRVHQDQLLAQLDQRVHQALLAIAEEAMHAKGRLESAQAELDLRTSRLRKLDDLLGRGHARQEEVDRARADLAIAQAELLSTKEDLRLKRLEYEKILAQIERRTIRAPLDGVVTTIHKEKGEFVAPNSPHVLTLVQLNPLLAVFSVDSRQARHLGKGDTVRLQIAGVPSQVTGQIEFISPVTDAESGTVRLKVRIDNPSYRYRSGERCTLDLR